MKNTIAIMVPLLDMTSVFPRAYESVLKQTYKDWKLYLIDAKKSTENVKEMVDILNNKHGERIIYSKQQGDGFLGVSLNELWDQIKNNGHKYFCFLCGDDVWHSQKLEVQFNAFEHADRENCILTTCHRDIKYVSESFYDNVVFTKTGISANSCNDLLSSFFFDKSVIDSKGEWTKGKLTSYHVQYLFDWEFAMESVKYGGTQIKKIGNILAYNDLSHKGSLGYLGRHDSAIKGLMQEDVSVLKKLYS